MKFSKSLIVLIMILISFSSLYSQNSNILYTITTTDSIFHIEKKLYSDNTIQTKGNEIFKNSVNNKGIIKIEDNLNRTFVKNDIDNSVQFLKQITKGNLKTFTIHNRNKMYVISKNDTVIINLDKSDGTNIDSLNSNIFSKLSLLANERPQLWANAATIKYDEENIQNFICSINENTKKMNEHKLHFINFSAFDYSLINYSNTIIYGFNILKLDYPTNTSSNFSIKYGLGFSYYNFPKYVEGTSSYAYMYYNDNGELITTYQSYILKAQFYTIELPLILNYDFLNTKLTPYTYIEIKPLYSFENYEENVNNIFTHNYTNNIFTNNYTNNEFVFYYSFALGLKYKLMKNYSINLESKFFYNSLYFGVSLNYYLPLKQ